MSKQRNWGRIVRSFIPAMVIALFVLGIGVAAAAENSAAQATAATVNIEQGDNFFNPNSVTVNVGDTIVWTNKGARPHDVTADNGAFSSPRRMMAPATFSWTATAPGTFTYVCTIHSGMNGTIVVQGAPAAAPRTGGGAFSVAIQPWQQLAAVGALVALGALSLIGRRSRRA